MNLSNYIPTGRTSLVKKGNLSLQVQTEYAYRPYPRLTTAISKDGQVLHKIEKKLKKAVESFEEQSKMQEFIKRQHQEILVIIKDDTFQVDNSDKDLSQSILEKAMRNSASKGKSDNSIKTTSSIPDKINTIPGVAKIFQLDNDGNFHNKISGEQFRKRYSVIFKNLHDIIEIFTMIPGITFTREKGVYEVDRNKLYMVSAGEEIYFVIIENQRSEIDYEQSFKEIIDSFY